MSKQIKEEVNNFKVKNIEVLSYAGEVLSRYKEPTVAFSRARNFLKNEIQKKVDEILKIENELLDKYCEKNEDGTRKPATQIVKNEDGTETEVVLEGRFNLVKETVAEYFTAKNELLAAEVVIDILPSNKNSFEELKRFFSDIPSSIVLPVKEDTNVKNKDGSFLDVTDVYFNQVVEDFSKI